MADGNAFVTAGGGVCREQDGNNEVETRITFGITSATALSLPHYIATEKKFYQAEGLAVDTIVAGAAVGVLHQLAAGSLNIAQAATDQTLRAINRGAPIRIIAGAASNAPFRMEIGRAAGRGRE